MKRITTLALATAALIVTARPSPAVAAGMADSATARWEHYRLLIHPGANPVGQVTFNPVPEGTLLAADPETGPVRLHTGASSGFDPAALRVLLGRRDATATTPAQQALAFDFGPGLFRPNASSPGELAFAVAVAPTAPAGVLQLPPSLANMTFVPAEPPSPGTPTEPVPTAPQEVEIPEPRALALWAVVVAGLGLRRARLGRPRAA